MGSVFGKIDVETPAHKVLRQADGYAIWRYPASVAATVHQSSLVDTTPERFERDAFITLARYIGVFTTPENKAAETSDAPEAVAMTAPVVMKQEEEGEQVAMTAPVVMAEGEGASGERSMTFLLPAKYGSVDEAPVPTNQAVQLSMMPGGRCHAVLEFSWGLSMKRGEEKAEELRQMLTRDGVEVVGKWEVHGYNSPFVLPWCRRNEVHIPVKVDDDAE